jgi:hypothetical protein
MNCCTGVKLRDWQVTISALVRPAFVRTAENTAVVCYNEVATDPLQSPEINVRSIRWASSDISP